MRYFILFIFILLSYSGHAEESQKKSRISGLSMWTIFDSLGAGEWQNYFTSITGALFYPGINFSSISAGGTNTSVNNQTSTLWRAQNLVSLKGEYPIDLVFIENINDMSYVDFRGKISGSIDDSPFMPLSISTVAIERPCASKNEADDYFRQIVSTIDDFVPSGASKKGMVLNVPYFNKDVRGKRITIEQLPVSHGTITIKVSDAYLKMDVDPEMSIDDLCSLFCNSSWGPGWTCKNSGSGTVSFSYWTNTNYSNLEYSDGGTGLILGFEDTNMVVEASWCCMDDENYTQLSSWSSNVSLYSMYKGLVEYLQAELPDAKLYWFIPTRFYVDMSSDYLKDSDGNWSVEKYMSTPDYINYNKLIECQKAVSDMYGIKVADINANCGIDITNVESYYYSNNVHPKKEGYLRWAETLAEMFESGNFSDDITTSINTDDSQPKTREFFSLDGVRHVSPPKGIYIVKDSTGRTYKIKE